jgi:hypothetical protein
MPHRDDEDTDMNFNMTWPFLISNASTGGGEMN